MTKHLSAYRAPSKGDNASVAPPPPPPPSEERISKNAKIVVTSPRWDDIGQVLQMLDRPYINYAPSTGFDCDMFFLNCGTNDPVDQQSLRNFVAKGGILYASDLTSSLIDSAFPGIFDFSSNGDTGHVDAFVRDEELKAIMGNSVTIYFDLGGWSILDSINQGSIILESAQNRKPIMVQVPFEKGTIFYTCFHNHVQANAKEKGVLQLLTAKLFANFGKTSVEGALKGMQKDVSDYKRLFMQTEK